MEETNSNNTIKEDTNEETTPNIENILVQPNSSTQSEEKQPNLPNNRIQIPEESKTTQ